MTYAHECYISNLLSISIDVYGAASLTSVHALFSFFLPANCECFSVPLELVFGVNFASVRIIRFPSFCFPLVHISPVTMRNELRDTQSSKNKKLLRLSPKSKKKSARTKTDMDSKNGDPHKRMANGFTSQENHDMKQAFDLFDKNHDGRISSDELGRVLRTLGHDHSQEEVEDMIKTADTNENGFVEFDEFVAMMRRWTHNSEVEGADGVSTSSSTKSDKQLEAFRVFDMDGNGYIDKHELRYTMRRLGENLSDEDIKEMFKEADLNGDGLIDYSEFSRLLHNFLPE